MTETQSRSRLERISDGIRSVSTRLRAKYGGIGTVDAILVPTSRSVKRYKDYFDGSYNKYQQLIELEDLDSELQSGLSTASIIVAQSMQGFTVNPGEKQDTREEELTDELKLFYNKTLERYSYDIAYKLFRDGDAIYVKDIRTGVGLRELIWLPMERLTVAESLDKVQWSGPGIAIQAANWYILNEQGMMDGFTALFSETLGSTLKMQKWPKEEIIHFNWGRLERTRDLWDRDVYNVFTDSPTMSLLPKLEKKMAAEINDSLIRDVMVPREHHKLPAEPFSPDLFQGANQVAKIQAAQQAASNVITSYAKGLEGRRVDRGYVTLNNVEIAIVEPRMQYTAQNDNVIQINDSINRSLGTPETVLAGRSSGRGTFASEIAIGAYLVMKAEFIAKRIVHDYVALAKEHLTAKCGTQYEDLYDQIDFKLQLLFFRAEIAKIVAVMASVGIYTRDELRDISGYLPLREDQEEDLVVINRGFTNSPDEEAAEAGKSGPDKATKLPQTPHTKDKSQKTL